MTQIGYARVPTADQHLDLQCDALNAASVDRIFEESANGTDRARPQLAAALDYVREGDTLIVWRLDRLGRSLNHLLDVVEGLTARGVHLHSMTEDIDTSTATERMVLGIFGALAEFERSLIQERTAAGLAAARARGTKGWQADRHYSGQGAERTCTTRCQHTCYRGCAGPRSLECKPLSLDGARAGKGCGVMLTRST